MVTDPPNKVKPGTVVADPFSTSTQAVKPGTIVADPFSAETQPPPKAPAAPVSQAPELDPFGDVIAKPSLVAKQEPMVPTTKMTEGMPFMSQRQNMMELERKEELSAEIARQNTFLNSPFAGMNEEQLNKAKQGIEAEKMAFDKIGQSIVQRTGSLKESAATLEATRKQLEQQIQENPALQPELSAQYDAAVEAHNKEARTVQALIPIAEDYASKLGLDEMAATMQDYEIKKGQGSWLGAIANKFTGSVGQMMAAGADLTMSLANSLDAVTGFTGMTDAERGILKEELIGKDASGIRDIPTDLMRIESTTKEYVQEKEKGLLGGAVLGLAGSALPMMTPAMSGIFLQSYDGMKQEMSGDEWAGVPESEKAALAAAGGTIAASLERLGFSNLAKSTPVVRQILGSSLPKMIPGMSAGQINRLVDAETDSWIRNAIVKTGSGFLAEAETGAAQELADIGMKEMYNEAKGRDLFQTPESFVDAFGQVVRSGIQEGIGGGIMSAPFAYSAARNAGAVGKQQTEKQYEFMEKLFTDPDYVDTFKAASEAKVKAGEVTQAEVDRAVDDLQVASKLMQKMPEDMPADKRRQAFDLLLEKERLSKKEKAMVEGKVQDIDNELRKLAGIRVVKTDTEIQPTPPAAKPTEEELNTDTKGDAERDELIRMRNDRGVFFDPMDDLPDQVVRTMNRVDNGVATDPVSLNEASNWLYGKRKQIASMATDPNRMMTRDQIDGLLAEIDDSISTIETYKYEQREKGSTDASENYTGENGEHQASAIDGANAVRTPNEGTAKIDPEGELTDDQLNALARDPSLAATKAVTGSGVDVNDSAAINELATRLQGLNKAGADYAAIIGKAAKAATTLRSITPGVNIQIHETADTIPVGDASSGNRGVLTITGRDANGNAEGTIHINLDQATENTIAHEIGHVALRQAFGADPKLFTQFKERIKKAVKPSDFKAVEAMMGKDYSSAEAPEEFLADLTQMVSDRIDSGDPLTAKEVTVIDKVVAIINDFLKALGIDPILVDPRDARATLEFFRDLGAAANAGVAVNTELAEGVGGVGTVRSSGKNEVEAGADAIAAMNEEVRDNTEFKEMPGGYPSYNLYQARNLMKRPSDKLKRVTDSNSADLWTSWHSIANVDGTLYGVTKYEDPDAASNEEDSAGFPKEFVWAYAPLSSPDSITETQTSDVAELMTQIRTARPVYSRGSEPLSTNQISEREELMPYGDIRGTIMSFVSEDAYSEGGNMTIDEVVRHIKEARGKYSVTNIKAILGEAVKAAQETWADVQSESMSNSEAMAYKDAISALKEMASMPDNADVRALVRTLSPRTERGQRVTDPDDQPEPSIRYSKGPVASKVMVDGKERSTTNSEGKPIHPTEKGVANFWKWFGDSKAVDDQGRPVVMYHGTPSGGFNEFDTSLAGKTHDSGWMGRGIYLTSDGGTAIGYANIKRGDLPKVYELYAKIESPMEWGEKDYGAYGLVMNGKSLPHDLDGVVYDKTGYRFNPNERLTSEQTKRLVDQISRVIREELVRRGHDGVIARYPDGGYEAMVLEPGQVKSSTENSGGFDASTTDIRYSKADSNVVRLLKGSEFLNAAPAQRKQMLIDARAQDAAERAAQEAKVVAQAKAAGAKQERVRSKEDLSKMKEQYKAFIDSYDAATKKSMAELEEEFIARNAKDVDLARAAIDNLKAQLQESKEDLKRVAKDGFNLGRGIGSVEGEVRGIGEGLKQAAAAQKKIREDVAAYLSLIKQKGDISVAQSKALINAAMRIKIGDPASFTKFENYVDKVMDDAAYAARIEQVRDLQAKATKRKHSLMSGIVKEFTSIDPENIPSSLMADYVSALKNLAKKVPSYSDMKGLVIQISNARPIPTAGKFDSATSFSELNQAITSIASNQLNSVEDFMSMLRDMRSVAKRASELNSLDPSDPNYLSDTQYNGLVDGLALTSRKLSDEYIKEVEPLKKALIGNIRSITVPYSSTSSADADPSENLLQDAATLSDKQLMSLDPIQLQDLSELMAQAVADRYVDVSRLFPIVTAAKVYSDAENMANNLRKVKMDQVKLGELLARTDVSFWSSVSGMGARVANVFDRGIVAPWIKADAGRIRLMRDTGSKVVDLKEKYKLGPKLTDSIKANAMRKQVPNYVMDKIGAVVRYLEEYELGTRVDRSDEFGQYGTRDMFEPSTLEKLDKGGAMHTAGADQTKKHWEKAWLSFPKTNGKVDPKDVYESVTKNDGRYLSKEEGAFFNELMEWKAKNITPKQRYANAIRGIPFNELQFHMPRVKIGPASTSDAEALATPVTNKNLGLRSGTGYSRSENQPLGLFETNIESLIHNNAESTGRDFYFNSALKEVSLALKEAGKNVAGEGNLEQVVAVIRDSVQQSINAGLTPLPSNGAGEKLFAAAMSAASMRALLRPLRVIPDLLSSSIDMAGRTGSLSIYPKAVTQLNGLKDDVKRLMDDTNSNHADRLSISRHIEIGRDEIVEQGKLAKAREYMSSLAEKIMAAPVWMTMFESSFMDAAGQKFDMEKYKSSAIYRATNKEAVNIAAAQADFVWSRYTGTGTIVGQKRKNNALFADVDSKTKTGRSLAWMTGYSERQRQALIDSFRFARETISSGSGAGKLKGSGTFLATATGTLISGLAYAMGMQMAHLAWMAAAGDDEEKKKAAENMEKMKSPEYAGGEALASMASLAGTKYGSVGRYSIRVMGSLYYAWLDSQETPTDPEAKREFNSRKAWAKEMVRNFTYSAPIETSGKGGSGKAVVHSMADAIPVVGSLSALIEQELEAVKSSKKLGKEAESIEEVAILTGQMSLALFNTVAFLYGIQFSSAALDKKAAGIMKDQELGKAPTTAAGFKARTMSRFNRMAEDDAQMESDRAFEDKGLIDKLLQDDPNDEE